MKRPQHALGEAADAVDEATDGPSPKGAGGAAARWRRFALVSG
ncbi:MAG: hypothetical protein V3U93_04580 [Alphaproteobacteria bacterium]